MLSDFARSTMFLSGLVGCCMLGASVLAYAAYCVITALIGHHNLSDRMQEINFVKNLSMAGGFLAFAAAGGGAYSLDAAMTRRRVAA